jgi:hypothetical protein
MRIKTVSNLAATAVAGERNIASRILDAATLEFDELPYSDASLARIAERAGLSKSLISYHFPTKGSLASGVVNLAYPNGIFMGGQRHSCAPLDAIVRSAEHVATCVTHNHFARAALKLLEQPELRHEGLPGKFIGWIGRCTDYLSLAKDNSTIRCDVDITTQARLIVGGVAGLISLAGVTGNRLTLVKDVSVVTRERLYLLGTDTEAVSLEQNLVA